MFKGKVICLSCFLLSLFIVNVTAQQGGATVNTGRARPAWVDNPDSSYNRSQFIAAVGHGPSRDMAERNALANLTAFFGQAIHADQTITNTYQEAVRNGVTTGWTDNIAMQNTIRTSASMDTLVGAEIKEIWQDQRANAFYAIAVMERARTAQVYRDMFIANQEIIKNLLNMNQTTKNSLEGFSRYQFAATIADINTPYVHVLNVINAPVPEGHVSGNTYRLEAQNIVREIPIGIRVTGDRSGRIQGAFAKAFSDLRFRSGGNTSRYILEVNVTLAPVDLPNNANKFVRMELSANLTDTSNRSVLLPYNFNNREGHTTIAEAESRSFLAAERLINNGDSDRHPPLPGYADLLKNYLSQLLPSR